MKKMFLLASVFAVASLSAQVIVSFNFNTALGNEPSYSADFIETSLVSSASISRGTGLTPASGAGSFNSSGFTLAGLDLTDYYSITLTPKVGASLSLSGVFFDGRRSSTGPTSWEVFSSFDGFASTLASGTMPNDAVTHSFAVPLTGFEGITDTLEFRIHAFGSASGAGTWRLDNILVPEPHEWGMIAGIGLLGVAFIQRVRRTQSPA